VGAYNRGEIISEKAKYYTVMAIALKVVNCWFGFYICNFIKNYPSLHHNNKSMLFGSNKQNLGFFRREND